MKLIVEADGGSRGNPGFSGAGAVVVDQHGVVLKEISVPLGIATNNFAEYTAVILGLEAAFEIDPSAEILVKMDSKLVVEQMSGRWKIKHPDMISLGARVQALVSGKKVEFTWIPRELNFRADALANAAMDGADLPSAAVMEFNSSLPSSIRAPKISETVCTTLILVRHGRTAHTESRKVSGGDGDNPDLSELGQRDAREVAAEVAKIGKSGSFSYLPKPTLVVHSPIRRAAQTAREIASALGCDLEPVQEFAEIGFGEWDGLTNEELISGYEDQYNKWRGSYDVAPPGGESLKDFEIRVRRGLDALLSVHRGKTLVVVAHVMPIRSLMRVANDASIAALWRPTVAPASISIVRFWGTEMAEVVCMNSTAHLSS